MGTFLLRLELCYERLIYVPMGGDMSEIDERTPQTEFFEWCGDYRIYIDTKYMDRSITVEVLYQMFKARLEAESKD